MALDVLGDAARAERCWIQVAGAGHLPVLDKLLAIQRKRGATFERGETCERLAELAEDPYIKKQLLEEAAESFAAGGDLVGAREIAERLIASHPLDVDAIACATAIVISLGDSKRAAAWLRRALGAWDAAGDRGDEDPRRADLWRRLGDAERALGNEQPAQQAYRRAVSVAPESEGALGSRRGLVALADVQSITSPHALQSSLFALVEVEQDPADALALARELIGSDPADARATFDLARALGAVLDEADERFLSSHPPRLMASDEAYAAPLDDAERRELIDDPADVPLGDLLELLAEAGPLFCPDARMALFEAGIDDAKRLPASSDAATMALFPQIAKLLGGPATLLYATPRTAAPDLRLLLASPPVIVIGPRLASLRAASRSELASGPHPIAGDAALRFKLGRLVELARPRRVFAAGSSPDAFALLVAALSHAFGPMSPPRDREIVAEAERLRSKLPVVLRKRLTEQLASLPPDALDPVAFRAGCERAADRAGLIACGDAAIAIELAGGPQAAPHVARLAASKSYLAVRRRLRGREVDDRTSPFKR
jgi:tetratricopeptide (TPR) repeat protein